MEVTGNNQAVKLLLQAWLGRADWDEMYRLICEFDPIRTSMLVDREHGRSLEVDTICGAVLERSDLPPFYGPGAVRVGSAVTDGSSGRRSAAESARGTVAPYPAGARYPNEL